MTRKAQKQKQKVAKKGKVVMEIPIGFDDDEPTSDEKYEWIKKHALKMKALIRDVSGENFTYPEDSNYE